MSNIKLRLLGAPLALALGLIVPVAAKAAPGDEVLDPQGQVSEDSPEAVDPQGQASEAPLTEPTPPDPSEAGLPSPTVKKETIKKETVQSVNTSSLPRSLIALLPELGPALLQCEGAKASKGRVVLEGFLSKNADSKYAGAVRLAVARCAARAGDTSMLDAAYRRAESELPELRGWLRAERARRALALGQSKIVDGLLSELDASDRHFLALAMDRLNRWSRQGRFAEVVQSVIELGQWAMANDQKARLAWVLARAKRGQGGTATVYLEELVHLWRRFPATDAGREAEAELLLAHADRGLQVSPLSLELLVSTATLRASKGNADGALIFKTAALARYRAAASGLTELLDAELSLSRKKASLAHAKLTLGLTLAKDNAIRDRLVDAIARTLRQYERYDEALQTYEKLGREAGTSARRAAALLEGGRMARRMGRVETARWCFDRFLARHDEHPEARAEALWALAWYAWRDGKLADADHFLSILQEAEATALDSSKRTYAEKATYWRARVLHRKGQIDEAKLAWRAIETQYPLSYYATLSTSWLARLDQTPASKPTATASTKTENRLMSPPSPEQIEVVTSAAVPAVTLYRLGMADEARAYLRHVQRHEGLKPDAALFLSALYRETGDESLAHWIVQANDKLATPPEKGARASWLSAFPRPFADIVDKEAKSNGIDPLIIWSVMRQESGFRTSARSHAKAHGLMQVLLPTARLVAKRFLNERQPSLSKVYTAEANVRYGAAYLRHLFDRFKGSPALAFAGYNAGPGAVDKWLKRFGGLDADEFVEEIPYDEARGYARKVIRSYAAYLALYGPQDAGPLLLPLTLPQRGPALAMAR